MNGARTIFRRKGYVLTALAAAVLLAASSGTAWAQVTGVVSHGEGGVLITKPSKVSEGETATISVSVMGSVAAGADATTVMVTLAGLADQVGNTNTGATEAEDTDFSFYPSDGALEFEFPAGPASGSARTYTRRASLDLDTTYDRDAEDEYVTLTVATEELTGNPTITNKTITIDDADTQTYTMNLVRRDIYIEGGMINVELEAEPAHVNGVGRISLRVADQDGNVLRNYPVTSMPHPVRKSVIAPMIVLLLPMPRIWLLPVIKAPDNDKNRVADTITIEGLMGSAGDYVKVGSVDVTVPDLHMLPGASAITAVAKDKARSGKTVTEIVEDGDPVYLTVTVDRGTARSGITDENLTVDIRPANAAQMGDYDLSVSRITLEGQDAGKQSNDVGLELKLSAISDEDVGAEDLVLNLVVSGPAATGADTSTGTFTIAIMDETEPKIWPLPEAEAYPAITDAMEAGAGE